MDPPRASSSCRPRRKNKKKKTVTQQVGPTSIHDVPDGLLKLVLLRLDSTALLVRAASTCKRWRYVIAGDDGGANFLRLARALHPPPAIVGHYHLDRDPTGFVPSSSNRSADAASRFSSLDFLPAAARARWEVADSLGGLVLLRQPDSVVYPDLIVCDPLARAYQGITHPHLIAGYSFADASLLAGEDGTVSMRSFRVLYRLFTGPRACVFTTAEGGDWRELDALGGELDHFTMAHVAGRVDGALCMGLAQNGDAILLDDDSLEFSKIDLPTGRNTETEGFSTFRVVHGAGTEPKTARIVHMRGEVLEVFRRRQATTTDDGGAWVLERSIPRLSEACQGLPGHPGEKRLGWIVEVVADGAGLVVLSVLDHGRRWLFSVDVETMEMAVVLERTYLSATCPYTKPWSPVFLACVGKRRRRRGDHYSSIISCN
jgi:hypothetical protein